MNTGGTVRPSDVLMRAAKLCDAGEIGACFAIYLARKSLLMSKSMISFPHSVFEDAFIYLQLFRPINSNVRGYWWGDPQQSSPDQKRQRVLALIFASTIAKWEAN